MSEEIKKGLLGIVVDETTISPVVPELSALTYRGYTVQESCDKCDFEEVAYLVLNGDLPNKKQSRMPLLAVLGLLSGCYWATRALFEPLLGLFWAFSRPHQRV